MALSVIGALEQDCVRKEREMMRASRLRASVFQAEIHIRTDRQAALRALDHATAQFTE
ncbi:unnamed protein product [Tenebrio molitor]|jgi:hypothetical protein|nr:unnamed protein product [Tenebrio molitor]